MTEVKLVACANGHRSTVPIDAVMTETASTFRCPSCGLGVTRQNFETVPEKRFVPYVGKSTWEKQWAAPRGNYEDRHPTDMVLHPLSEIREWDEALAVLGIQDSDQTPAEAIRELNAEIERLRAAKPFYGAECPRYPNCSGGCGLGCTHEIEAAHQHRG